MNRMRTQITASDFISFKRKFPDHKSHNRKVSLHATGKDILQQAQKRADI